MVYWMVGNFVWNFVYQDCLNEVFDFIIEMFFEDLDFFWWVVRLVDYGCKVQRLDEVLEILEVLVKCYLYVEVLWEQIGKLYDLEFKIWECVV